MSWIHSRRIRFLCAGVTLFFILFAALRLGFIIGSADHAALAGESAGVILQTISIGLRFDLRLALLIMLPVAFAASLPRVNLLRSRFTSRWRPCWYSLSMCSTSAITPILASG